MMTLMTLYYENWIYNILTGGCSVISTCMYFYNIPSNILHSFIHLNESMKNISAARWWTTKFLFTPNHILSLSVIIYLLSCRSKPVFEFEKYWYLLSSKYELNVSYNWRSFWRSSPKIFQMKPGPWLCLSELRLKPLYTCDHITSVLLCHRLSLANYSASEELYCLVEDFFLINSITLCILYILLQSLIVKLADK